MHPYFMEALARDRIATLHAAGSSPRRMKVLSRRGSRQQRRERVGWVLVNLGLRLVDGGSADCRPARSLG